MAAISRLDVELDVLQQMLGIVFKVPLKCAGVHYGSCCEQHFWVTDQTDPVEKPWDDLNNPRSTSPRHLPAGTVPWSWPWLPTHTGSELVKTVAQVIGYVIEYTTGIHHPGWFCRNSASSVANPIANAAPKHVHSIQSYAQWPSWELCPEYLRQLCGQRQRFQWGKIRKFETNEGLASSGIGSWIIKGSLKLPHQSLTNFWMEPDLSPNRSCTDYCRCTQDPGSSGVGS